MASPPKAGFPKHEVHNVCPSAFRMEFQLRTCTAAPGRTCQPQWVEAPIAEIPTFSASGGSVATSAGSLMACHFVVRLLRCHLVAASNASLPAGAFTLVRDIPSRTWDSSGLPRISSVLQFCSSSCCSVALLEDEASSAFAAVMACCTCLRSRPRAASSAIDGASGERRMYLNTAADPHLPCNWIRHTSIPQLARNFAPVTRKE